MSLTIIQLTGKGAAGAQTAAVAATDIPENAEIVAVDWTLWADTNPGDQDVWRAQLSFISTDQFDINDARGVISEIGQSLMVTGVAVSDTGANKMAVFPEPLEVSGGERIFVHTESVGTPTVDFTCLVHLKVGRGAPRRSRRRR